MKGKFQRKVINYQVPYGNIHKIINKTNIPYKDALRKAVNEFDSYGYQSACELTQSLYTNDEINLLQKSQIMDQLVNVQMMTSKERKFFKKLQKSA